MRTPLAMVLLDRLLGRDDRDEILGDLEEGYLRRLRVSGAAAAKRWLWRQALSVPARLAMDRFLVRALRRFIAGSGFSPREGRRGPTGSRAGKGRELPGSGGKGRGIGLLCDLAFDFRHAVRSLARSPVFVSIAVGTTALAIGCNATIFSVLHATLLRPLAFGNPERIVQVATTNAATGEGRSSWMSTPNFWDLRESVASFEEMAGVGSRNFLLAGGGYPSSIQGSAVSAGFFRVLGVSAILGRGFLPGEDQPGAANRVVILAHDSWTSRFGADPDVVGRTIRLDDVAHEVVGVMPPGYPWLSGPEVLVPLVRDPGADRGSAEIQVIARVPPDVAIADATRDVDSALRRLSELHAGTTPALGATLLPSSRWIAGGRVRSTLWILMGSVALLMAIACVNLANLILVRATKREREVAVIAALGAGRGRIVRRTLLESLLITLVGAGLGVLLAFAGVGLMRAFEPGSIPRMDTVTVSPAVLVFSFSAALVTGLVAGLLPLFQLPLGNLLPVLRDVGGGTLGGRVGNRIRKGLVGIEVALSAVLLVGSGLLVRSFLELQRVDLGFQTENRLAFSMSVLPSAYSDPEGTLRVVRDFIDRIEAQPGVISVAAASSTPTTPGPGMSILPDGVDTDAEYGLRAQWRIVTPRYFETLGIPLLSGRTFTKEDRVSGEWFAPIVISLRLANALWPGENPLGRRAELWSGRDRWGEVVGVVGNVRDGGLSSVEAYMVYLPAGGFHAPTRFLVHTEGPDARLTSILRQALAELNPRYALTDATPFSTQVQDLVAPRRFNSLLMSLFAGAALVLALVGVYGVLSFSVECRRRELGLRMALGARGGLVLLSTVAEGMRPVLWGLGIGLCGALGLSRVMSGFLFMIGPTDPVTYVFVGAFLTLAALIACFHPAKQALELTPMETLRND